MSKIVDTIKAFAASDNAEGDDAITAAVKAVQDARDRHARLYAEGEDLKRKARAVAEQLGNAALDDDRSAFDKLDQQHQRLLADIRHNSAAQEAASARLKETQQNLHATTAGDFLRKVERKMRLTERQAEEVEQAERAYISATNRLIKTRRDLSAMIQARGVIPPLGLALDGNSILDLIALDLFRLNPVGVLSGPGQFKTPGASSGTLLDAAKITPLPDAIKLANVAMLDKLKAAPVPPAPTETKGKAADAKGKPEAVDQDADADLLNVPPAPRLNASEIMAAMPKAKHTTIDARKGAKP